MARQKLIIHEKMPGTNEIVNANRTNKHAGANQKKKWTGKVVKYCTYSKLKPVEGQIDLKITWYEPNMRRDKDNIMGSIKFIQDGLVDAGVIKNDGWKEIRKIFPIFEVDKKYPRVEVELIECVDNV